MRPTHAQLTRECEATFDELKAATDANLAKLDATLADLGRPLPWFDPDLTEMITRPAATVAGSVNLLDATMAALHRPAPLMKPTCDEAGNWRYVPATEIDGPRVPVEGEAA